MQNKNGKNYGVIAGIKLRLPLCCSDLTPMDRAAQRSQTVCILAVPATMTCHDLLTFTAACHGDIQHLRIIRDGSPNRYMALLTFRSQVHCNCSYSLT